ncbi:MAG: TetR/AcrR family transcriptional regulator [Bacillota bacterium]
MPIPKRTFFNLPKKKRERILDVALRAFAARPYERVSVAAIAEESGIAKGSIYQYFEDKLDLYRYLLKLAADAKMQYFARSVEISGEDLFEDLRTLFEAESFYVRDNPTYHRLATRFINSPVRDEIFPQLKDRSERFLRQLVESAHEAGSIRTDVSVDLAVFFINTLLSEFGSYLLRRHRKEWEDMGSAGDDASDALEEAIEQMMSLIESGLGVTSKKGSG